MAMACWLGWLSALPVPPATASQDNVAHGRVQVVKCKQTDLAELAEGAKFQQMRITIEMTSRCVSPIQCSKFILRNTMYVRVARLYIVFTYIRTKQGRRANAQIVFWP